MRKMTQFLAQAIIAASIHGAAYAESRSQLHLRDCESSTTADSYLDLIPDSTYSNAESRVVFRKSLLTSINYYLVGQTLWYKDYSTDKWNLHGTLKVLAAESFPVQYSVIIERDGDSESFTSCTEGAIPSPTLTSGPGLPQSETIPQRLLDHSGSYECDLSANGSTLSFEVYLNLEKLTASIRATSIGIPSYQRMPILVSVDDNLETAGNTVIVARLIRNPANLDSRIRISRKRIDITYGSARGDCQRK